MRFLILKMSLGVLSLLVFVLAFSKGNSLVQLENLDSSSRDYVDYHSRLLKMQVSVPAFLSLSNNVRLETVTTVSEVVDNANSSVESEATYATHPEIVKFIKFMEEKHQFSEIELRELFDQVVIDQVQEKRLIGYTNRAPERKMDWERYRKQFLTRSRIQGGVEFWSNYQAELKQVRKKYGIPEEIIIATLGMESFYGRRNGNISVLEALTVFVAEKGRRHQFYFRELEHFLKFCKKNRYDPFLIKGSYSGAMGPAQFISTSAFYYGRDGDSDNRINLFTNFDDIFASMGYYYKKCKWNSNRPVVKRLKSPPSKELDRTKKKYLLVTLAEKKEHWKLYSNYQALKCYNNSDLYALTLFQLGRAMKRLYQQDLNTSASKSNKN